VTRVLLDTHAFLWWLDGDESLSVQGREVIGDTGNEIFVSAVSAWEISTKVRLGKLPGAIDVAANLSECLLDQGFLAMNITVPHAQRAGALLGAHRDPFDRMLIAQALLEGCSLMSNEAIFDACGVTRIW